MKIEEIISESFNVPANSITDDSVLMEFEEWDSMAHMFFITKVEEGFAINLDGDEIANMRSVKDIKKVLESKGVTVK